MNNTSRSEPVRVLCLFTLLDRGGAETMCMNIYRNIDRSRVQFDFMVYYPQKGEYEDEIESLGGRIYRIPHLEPKNIVSHIKAAQAFFIEHPEYRIVHDHMGENGALICREAKKAGVGTIIVHAHTDYYPIIKWKQLCLLQTKIPTLSMTECKLRMLLPIMMSSATDFFACGENAAKVFRQKQNKAVIIKNGIDIARFVYNEEMRKQKRTELACGSKFIIGNVARLNDNKNQSFAIEIMRELVKRNPNAEMWFIGHGPNLEALQNKTNQYNLQEHIRFLGVRSDVNELLQAVDVFLFPSIKEGLPVSCIEAQAAGLPCVFSDGFDPKTAITENCKVISLTETAEKWAEEIDSFSGFQRKNTSEQIRKAGYDIKETSRWLQDFYLNAIKR